jgi:hypothetical protein
LVETPVLDSDPVSGVELDVDPADAVAESDDAAVLVDDSEAAVPVSAAASPYPVVTAATSQAATATPQYPPTWVAVRIACVPAELALWFTDGAVGRPVVSMASGPFIWAIIRFQRFRREYRVRRNLSRALPPTTRSAETR